MPDPARETPQAVAAASDCNGDPHAYAHEKGPHSPVFVGRCMLCGAIDWKGLAEDVSRLIDEALAGAAGERPDGDAPARGCEAPQSDEPPIRRVLGGPHLSSTPPEGRTALCARYAEALAAKFTSARHRYDRETDSEVVEKPEPADRVDSAMSVQMIAADGHPSFRMVTCNEAAEVCAAVRDDVLAEALRRAEQAEAALARVRAALSRPVLCGPSATPAVPVAAIERALDVPADGEQPPTSAEETDHG